MWRVAKLFSFPRLQTKSAKAKAVPSRLPFLRCKSEPA
jgi:hypothetical protein